MSKQITLAQFVAEHGIKFSAHEVPVRPDGLMGDSAFHFRCHINNGQSGYGKASFGLYFSKGNGLGPALPTVEDVLDCLASDASGYENAVTFEEWASEYGYDTDSRKAEKVYRVVKRQAEQLKRVLGQEAYNNLLWNTERL